MPLLTLFAGPESLIVMMPGTGRRGVGVRVGGGPIRSRGRLESESELLKIHRFRISDPLPAATPLPLSLEPP